MALVALPLVVVLSKVLGLYDRDELLMRAVDMAVLWAEKTRAGEAEDAHEAAMRGRRIIEQGEQVILVAAARSAQRLACLDVGHNEIIHAIVAKGCTTVAAVGACVLGSRGQVAARAHEKRGDGRLRAERLASLERVQEDGDARDPEREHRRIVAPPAACLAPARRPVRALRAGTCFPA